VYVAFVSDNDQVFDELQRLAEERPRPDKHRGSHLLLL
jgi:hypothetical protein